MPSNGELLAQAQRILHGDHPAEDLFPLHSIPSDDPNTIAAVALKEEKIVPSAGSMFLRAWRKNG